MKIREAILADIPVLAEFQQHLARETEDTTLEDATLQKGLLEIFSDPRKGNYYVAEMDGAVVGCLMTTFEWSEWRNGHVLWIQSVYVAMGFRGKGVYTQLYDYIRTIVNNDESLRGIRLYAEKNNKAAQRVYSRLGMNGDHYVVYEWMKK